MFVRVRSTHESFHFLLETKGIPTFLQDRQAETFEHCAMSIDQDRSDNAVRSESHEGKSCCVIASDDVRRLCMIFLVEYINIKDIPAHWTFKVTIHRTFEDTSIDDQTPNLPQRRLLEPFTILHGTPDFEIVGSVSSAYCTSIAAHVSRMSPTAEVFFDGIFELWEKGCKAWWEDDPSGAIKFHKIAFAHLHYFYFPRMFRIQDQGALHPHTEYVAYAARLNIRSNLANLHFSLKRFEDASFWACFGALYEWEKMKTLDWTQVRAELIYVAAISSVLLHDRKKAVEIICGGLKSMRTDVYQDKELVKYRKNAWLLMRGGGEAEDLRLLQALGVSGWNDHWNQICRVWKDGDEVGHVV